jgi:hypothetical protein
VTPDNRRLFGHLALALGRYVKEVQRDGITPPAELLALANLFADCASLRQGTTTAADSSLTGEGGAMTKLLLSKREAAGQLGISVRSVERILADPSTGLDSVRIEGSVRVRTDDLAAYVAGLAGARSFRDKLEEKAAG